MKNYVSIDIGGTAIKYGVLDEKGYILEHDQMDTEASLGGPSILLKAVGIVERYREKYEICGICISTAGMVDTKKGEIIYSGPQIPDYIGTAFKQTMEDKFQVPCEVENDVNCAGLSEHVSGAAKGSSVTLCLTIGTGIGGCMVIGGQVFHGHSNSACEVGYMRVADGQEFQNLGSASALCRRVTERKEKEGIAGKWNGYQIFLAAKAGDVICIEEIDRMVDILGEGIANICYVMNPQVVVLGGGIMAQKEYLLPKFRDSLRKYLLPSIAEKTVLKVAEHGNRAGMLGAFYHFKRMQKEQ